MEQLYSTVDILCKSMSPNTEVNISNVLMFEGHGYACASDCLLVYTYFNRFDTELH